MISPNKLFLPYISFINARCTQHPKGHHLEGMSSMMTSEKRPRRRSIHRRSEKRIRSAKKAARPELCKNDWEDWTKARSDCSSFDSEWAVYSLEKSCLGNYHAN